MMRASPSGAPPAEKPTTIRTGRDGYASSAARADEAAATAIRAQKTDLARNLKGFPLCRSIVWRCCYGSLTGGAEIHQGRLKVVCVFAAMPSKKIQDLVS